MMQTMKAVVLHGVKNIETLKYEEVPVPVPKSDEVLVRLKASALNHRDVWILQGLYAKIRLPVVLGSDGSGIIEACGESVDKKWINQSVIINPALGWGANPAAQKMEFRIFGMPDNGTQAKYVTIPASNVVAKPNYLSYEEAAAIPLGGLTGYRALFTQGQLKKGQRVLITGIGGGVASLMMQMVFACEAELFVTSGSDEKIEKALHLGAQGGANYNADDWTEKLRQLNVEDGFDLIVDSSGGPGFLELIELVKPGGSIICFGATAGNVPEINLRRIFWKQVRIQGTTMGNVQDFRNMVDFFQTKKIKPVIDEIFPLSGYLEAYQRMIGATQFGKIVLAHD
jgi:NADPH:quinone reductase-like Zn-dependent oxidoreductase